MPRTCRAWRPGAGQHFISRFVDRRYSLRDSIDRSSYLRAIAIANMRWDWGWLSYALMSTHVHNGLIAGLKSPERFYRSAHLRFAQHYKSRFGTLGPVFAARPKNFDVDNGELVRMVAYHHRNPVEAGVVTRPSDSRWTSHRAYLRLDPAPPFLNVEWALSRLGFEDSAGGRACFDEFVCTFDFQKHDKALRSQPERMSTITRSPYQLDVSTAEQLLLAAADACTVEAEQVFAGRRPAALRARRVIAFAVVEVLGGSMTDVARVLRRPRTTLVNLLSRTSAHELTIVDAAARQVVSAVLGKQHKRD